MRASRACPTDSAGRFEQAQQELADLIAQAQAGDIELMALVERVKKPLVGAWTTLPSILRRRCSRIESCWKRIRIRNTMKIRVLLADPNTLIRRGVAALFQQYGHLSLVGETQTIAETYQLSRFLTPDIVLLEKSFADGSSIDQIPLLRGANPNSRILIFTTDWDTESQLTALRLGAMGVFYKNQSDSLLVKAVETVHSGHVWVDRAMTTVLWQNLPPPYAEPPEKPVKPATGKALLSPLSKRECNIACLASHGFSAKKIGEQLHLSEKTVRNQLTLIYEKLNIKNQVDLCIKATSLGFCKLACQSRDRDKCPEIPLNPPNIRDNPP